MNEYEKLVLEKLEAIIELLEAIAYMPGQPPEPVVEPEDDNRETIYVKIVHPSKDIVKARMVATDKQGNPKVNAAGNKRLEERANGVGLAVGYEYMVFKPAIQFDGTKAFELVDNPNNYVLERHVEK